MLSLIVTKEELTPKELHQYYLENSPYKETKNLSKKDRFERGLPPNQFHEQLYELTINPTTGVPEYESKVRIQRELEQDKYLRPRPFIVPGETPAQPWYEIGPNNNAGRSRAAQWDLSDGSNQRVFAGGVSGGLWKNENITDGVTKWTRVTGVPGNLAVSVIVQDPNNTSVLYAGTGESYTTGDAAGNGIYKSTNGGNNWSLVFGQGTSGTVTQTNSNNTQGAFFVNDIILYDHDKNPATDAWIFAALAGSFSSRSYGSQNTILDSQTYGLYKSTDAGGLFH